ncbi:MAG: VWA domain-containing protein [Ignavibacteriales bacterium]|nr:VWA domain-containing protein [Ignavibacteriales bacterium]
MKKLVIVLLVVFASISLLANGVGIVNASNQTYLKVETSIINVEVENQIALIKTTQSFRNIFGVDKNFKYAFPLPLGASAVSLKWKINGIWKTAMITPQPPDTSLPGGNPHPNLLQYLGDVPLYFDILDTLKADSVVTIELTYVEFLKYSFGNVNFEYPNDYTLIQQGPFNTQEFRFTLNSSRTIDAILLLSHNATQQTNNGNYAYLEYTSSETLPNLNYKVLYTLSLNELGLFSFSTFPPDSLVPDGLDNGFFVFVAEPDPSNNTDIIDKVFTLIIDRSGSMSGTKMEQAKNAATYIVQNLNEGDKFNIIDFDDIITSFSPIHVDFNPTNMNQALAYISSIYARGLTNISGAFDVAVPQFSTANDSTANIIIFLTDGEATAGITNTEQLIQHINNLIQTTETNILLFSFGIGPYINEQLLTQISLDNNGFATFLLNNELEEVLTNFYQQIRNPVLLNTSISFDPQYLTQIFPDPLPNLYKGQQMIVSGRYSTPGNINIILSGEAFGQNVQYNYPVTLADSNVISYSFLPKVWAKQKIEYLLVQYYLLDPNSPQAMLIKQQIIELSVAFGVISPFTSFGNPTNVEDEIIVCTENVQPDEFRILGNYPNPFNPSTTIRFTIGKDIQSDVVLKIYNSLGELVRTIKYYVSDAGTYEIFWDGKFSDGKEAPSDVYIYTIDFGIGVLASKMILIK